MKKKVIRVVFLTCLVVLAIMGCKKEKEPEEVKEEVVVEETEPEEVIPENQNLLTGVADLSEMAIGKRPVAVMVNNVEDALPQYGIAEADIIFETQVESDLTRLIAFYADYTKVPKVCAIRSCRYYHPAITESFDAFYVYWGMDETRRSYVESLDVTKFDGMTDGNGLFGRDNARLNSGYSLEHTAYFDGTKFASVVDSKGIRTELEEEKKGTTAFIFNGLEEQIKPEGDACTNVNVNFGGALATFTYDEATNTYLKQINGKPQMDGVKGTQLAFTNLFILETDISVRTDSKSGHKQINWQGGPEYVGYYVSNGAVQKINWSKETEEDYFHFYDENGKEISVNRGKSYIALNYKGQATFE